MYYCRYGTWNAQSCTLSEQTDKIEWRCTPKSKVFKAVLPVLRLPDAHIVANATNAYIDIETSDEIVNLINRWTHPKQISNQIVVMPVQTHNGTIRLHGSCTCMNSDYQYHGNALHAGDTVAVRLSPSIQEIGRGIGQYKVVLNLVDAMILT